MVTVPRVSQPVLTIREKPQSRIMAFLGELPTTQARVLVTLGAFILTTLVYLGGVIYQLVHGGSVFWTPAYIWLGFLVVMSGLDAAQFFGKRKTDAAYIAAQQGTASLPDPDPPSPIT